MIYGGVHVAADQEILSTAHEHYATHTILDLRSQRTGTRVRKIKLFENAHDASHEQILTAIDRNIRPETRVLGMTWVHSGSGVKLPIDKIGALVDKHNQGRSDEQRIIYVVDGVHGFGVEDLSFPEMNCDFFSSPAPISGCSARAARAWCAAAAKSSSTSRRSSRPFPKPRRFPRS
nr:hypothetical protein GCM10020185_60440 [Pseudomonas brassicacearum subsp. brassicacearum]